MPICWLCSEKSKGELNQTLLLLTGVNPLEKLLHAIINTSQYVSCHDNTIPLFINIYYFLSHFHPTKRIMSTQSSNSIIYWSFWNIMIYTRQDLSYPYYTHPKHLFPANCSITHSLKSILSMPSIQVNHQEQSPN